MEYTIGQVAETVGLTVHTLRYYEKEGLLPPIKRNTGGKRIFDAEDINWIDFINCMRDTGMSLQDIKRIVALTLEGENTIPERKELLREHRVKVQAQIKRLQAYTEKIDKKLAWYDDRKKSCS